jgi:hypothetical protein
VSESTHIMVARGDRLIGVSDWMRERAKLTGKSISRVGAKKELERPWMPEPVTPPGVIPRKWSLRAVRSAYRKAEQARAVLRGE